MPIVGLSEPATVLSNHSNKTDATTKQDNSWTAVCQNVANNAIKSLRIGAKADLAPLGVALQINETINRIIVDFSCLKDYRGTVFSILDFLATSKSLYTLELIHANVSDQPVAAAMAVLLEAVLQNPSVKDVAVNSKGFLYPPFLKPDVPPTIPLVFRACKFVETLWLEHLEEILLVEILGVLKHAKRLQLVSLVPRHYSVATFHSVSTLIQASQSIQNLELHGCRLTGKRLQPVMDGLEKSKTVTELSLHDCRLAKPATELLEGFRCSNSSVKKLTLGRNVRFSRPVSRVMVSLLEQNVWKSVDISKCDSLIDVDSVMDALPRQSSLRELSLGMIDTPPSKKDFFELVGLRQFTCQVPNDTIREEVLDAIRVCPDLERVIFVDCDTGLSNCITLKRPSVVAQIHARKAKCNMTDSAYETLFAANDVAAGESSSAGDDSSSGEYEDETSTQSRNQALERTLAMEDGYGTVDPAACESGGGDDLR